jgi:hypothetical protein
MHPSHPRFDHYPRCAQLQKWNIACQHRCSHSGSPPAHVSASASCLRHRSDTRRATTGCSDSLLTPEHLSDLIRPAASPLVATGIDFSEDVALFSSFFFDASSNFRSVCPATTAARRRLCLRDSRYWAPASSSGGRRLRRPALHDGSQTPSPVSEPFFIPTPLVRRRPPFHLFNPRRRWTTARRRRRKFIQLSLSRKTGDDAPTRSRQEDCPLCRCCSLFPASTNSLRDSDAFPASNSIATAYRPSPFPPPCHVEQVRPPSALSQQSLLDAY